MNFGLIDLGLINFDISVIIPALKEWDEYPCPRISCIKLFTFAINVELLGVFKWLPFVVKLSNEMFQVNIDYLKGKVIFSIHQSSFKLSLHSWNEL